MNKTLEYIDALKKSYKLTSDYQLSKKLGVSRERVSNWRNERNMFDDDMCLHVAELLDLNPLKVIAEIHADRAKKDTERSFWQNIAKRVQNIAAGLAGVSLCLIVGISSPTPSHAAPLALNGDVPSIHYAKWLKRLLERLRGFFDRLPSRTMLPVV